MKGSCLSRWLIWETRFPEAIHFPFSLPCSLLSIMLHFILFVLLFSFSFFSLTIKINPVILSTVNAHLLTVINPQTESQKYRERKPLYLFTFAPGISYTEIFVFLHFVFFWIRLTVSCFCLGICQQCDIS